MQHVALNVDTEAELVAMRDRVRSHGYWLVLKLRGVQMIAADGRGYTTILIERGETAEARRRRVSARWGSVSAKQRFYLRLAMAKLVPRSRSCSPSATTPSASTLARYSISSASKRALALQRSPSMLG
jgi:hypothetical protein